MINWLMTLENSSKSNTLSSELYHEIKEDLFWSFRNDFNQIHEEY